MKILFVMRHSGYVRNFESTLRLLCDRQHVVHLAYQTRTREWLANATDIADQLSAAYPNFTHGMAPQRTDAWGLLGAEVRLGLDYLRYLTPEYRNASKLRARVRQQVAEPILRHADRSESHRRWLARALRAADRSIPTSDKIDRFIDEQRPDMLLVTPLIEPGSPQSDYLRSAAAKGVRTVLCVASWDNLTNKGLIHDPLDLVVVWNDDMKREAVAMHGVASDRVAVTGAQPFDHWFTWQPSTTREEFCGRVGIDPAHPYVLYVCSSKFVAREEVPFVRQWVEQLRQSKSEVLRSLGVLVRPHPQNADQWRQFDLTGVANFAIYPPTGAPPVDARTRSDYYDSIYHSAAVVGINTTAEIESAIVGRPVFTVLAPEFRETQEGTLHFEHLRAAKDGLVHVASDVSAHLRQLETSIRQPHQADEKGRRFVERFVRPHGIDTPATPKFVAALEALGAQPPRLATGRPAWAPVARRLLHPWAVQLHQEARAAAKAKAEKAAAQKVKARAKARAIAAKEKARAKAAEEARARDRAEAKRLAAERAAQTWSATGSNQHISWRNVLQAFQRLPPGDRARFMHETGDDIPTELLMDLYGGRAEQLDFADATIYLRISSKPERLRLRACAKEPWTVDWLRHTVHAGDVLYDIGANVGAYSLVAAKKPGGGARVYAFEPSYPNLVALCTNIVLNNLAAEITALPIALSDRNGLDTFMLHNMAPGTARHVLASTGESEETTVYPQPVLTYRLDDLIDLCGLPMPNHIKLDVDGGELALLRGASKTLRSPTLRSLMMEVSTSLSQPVTEQLTSCGLRLHTKIDRKTKAGEDLVWYGVFVRDDGEVVNAASPAVEVVSD